MEKRKNKALSIILSIVSGFLAFAIVAGVSVFLVYKNWNKPDDNVQGESVTSFSIIGNADSENSDIQSQIAANKDGETETETVTDKLGNMVTNRPSNNPGPVNPGNPANPNVVVTPPDPSISTGASQQASAFGFTWDPINGVFYSTSDPWQRQFGYNKYYDELGGYVALWYDTVRVKFNYGGFDWLVQFWKGQYGFLLLGAEAGVYYKTEGDETSQYVCTDNSKRLKIGYTCYNKGEVLFTRPYQDTWWLTGFVPGKLDKYADRSQLQMKIRITLKDAEMKDAFVEALQQPGTGFTQGNASAPDTFYTSGNDVYIMWQTDRSKTS